jgi:hypothetical protein
MPLFLKTPFLRRDLLVRTSMLSVAGVAVLAGMSPKALAADAISAPSAPHQDVDILNEILGTEYEGIGAYQIFIDGGLFQPDMLKLARLFQGHHKEHRDVLTSNIREMGGVPATAKTNDHYALDLNTAAIKTQESALQLVVKLELGVANSYLEMLPSTHGRELAKTAGRIAADEVMHWTTFTRALQEALPPHAMSFGV